ncbi:hypothetical protein phD2B_009 [Lelliottia phage phD2B]|uniref:Uncharacterized protein n=1 Tax=Lelliottia phage phD2B TaxID=1542498 RepID=A0A088FSA2_9CAUD|nr:hypothetical protein phD2B_009 [Lelliottia phage phD2B]AIM51236.1 hypothetical protein phD2B_009 [Lelliottia phage phD2B]
MRNFEKTTRTTKKVYGEEVVKKGSKCNKTKRGGGDKGFFFDMNTGKSMLAMVHGGAE